jgi:hypothetical protein
MEADNPFKTLDYTLSLGKLTRAVKFVKCSAGKTQEVKVVIALND